MSEIADFLNAQYGRIEARERGQRSIDLRALKHCPVCGLPSTEWNQSFSDDGDATFEPCGHSMPVAEFGERFGESSSDPFVLADIESKRQILREVMSWRHDVVEGDCWFTCGAATEERDGGECCNDNQRNECTCGLDVRREKILRLFAAPFSGEPGYKAEEWAV